MSNVSLARRKSLVNSEIKIGPRISSPALRVEMKEGVNLRRRNFLYALEGFKYFTRKKPSAQIGDAQAEIRNPFRSRANDLAPCNPALEDEKREGKICNTRRFRWGKEVGRERSASDAAVESISIHPSHIFMRRRRL